MVDQNTELTPEEAVDLLVAQDPRAAAPDDGPASSDPIEADGGESAPTVELPDPVDKAKPDDGPDEAAASDEDVAADEPDADEGGEADDDAPTWEPDYDAEFDIAHDDGKAERVTLSRLADSFVRQAVLDKRANHLKEQRRQAEEQFVGAQQARDAYLEKVKDIEGRLKAAEPRKPDESLKHSDPTLYAEQATAYLNWFENDQAVKAERARVETEKSNEQAKHGAQYLERQHSLLMDAIPEWRDEKVRDKEFGELSSYLQSSIGYDPQEIAQASDHRAFVMARKAMAYDKLMAESSKSVSKKRIKAAPTIKAARAKSKPVRTGLQKAVAALDRSGDIDDAIRVLEQGGGRAEYEEVNSRRR